MTQRGYATTDRAKLWIFASVVGNGWVALMAIVFSPVYIRYIGIEGYGLIAAFLALQGIISLFEPGFGRTLTRELARYQAARSDPQRIRDMQWTFVLICGTAALLLTVLLIASAPWIAAHWLRLGQLDLAEVTVALRLAACVTGLRWLCNQQRGMLMGASDLYWVNGCSAVMATLRGAGSAAVAAFVSPSLQAYFLVQLAVSGIELVVMMLRIDSVLPRAPRRAKASIATLRDQWSFSAGVTVIASLTVLSTQLDRVLLSKLFSLREFGYYAFAAAVAGAVRLLFYPPSQAHAHFALFVEQERRDELAAAFHGCCQPAAILLMSACAALCVFTEDVLNFWGLDGQTVAATAPVVRFLVIGTFFTGIMTLPQALQLAHGKTRSLIGLKLGALLTYVPLVWLGAQRYGPVGAAAAWSAVNIVYVLVGAPLLLGVLPRVELWRWLRDDFLRPLAGVSAVACAVKMFVAA